jgi:hypothetical protein
VVGTGGSSHYSSQDQLIAEYSFQEEIVTARFFRFAILFALVLLTAQVAQPYIVPLMYAATTPRLVVARGNLSEAERATIYRSVRSGFTFGGSGGGSAIQRKCLG